jgi:hypothetical protein
LLRFNECHYRKILPSSSMIPLNTSSGRGHGGSRSRSGSGGGAGRGRGMSNSRRCGCTPGRLARFPPDWWRIFAGLGQHEPHRKILRNRLPPTTACLDASLALRWVGEVSVSTCRWDFDPRSMEHASKLTIQAIRLAPPRQAVCLDTAGRPNIPRTAHRLGVPYVRF